MMAKRDEVFAQGAGGGASWPPIRLAVDNTVGAGALPSGGGGGTYGGMDPWQASVEKRLDSLDRRVGSVDVGVSDLRERMSRVETKIDHLPSKGYIITALTVGAGAVVGLLTMLSKLGILAAG